MTDIKSSFSFALNEPGFEVAVDWNLPRREFSNSIKRLFDELTRNRAAIPLPLPPGPGVAASILAGIECKGCDSLCCARAGAHVFLFPPEAVRLNVPGSPDSRGQVPMPLPCKFLKKNQCSVYPERPARCRFYPVQIGGMVGSAPNSAFVGLDSFCPRSAPLALRLYLAAYDLFHGLKAFDSKDV